MAASFVVLGTPFVTGPRRFRGKRLGPLNDNCTVHIPPDEILAVALLVASLVAVLQYPCKTGNHNLIPRTVIDMFSGSGGKCQQNGLIRHPAKRRRQIVHE